MQLRALGATGPQVGSIGLGCMGMSALYGPADRDEGIATIRAAIDAGITLRLGTGYIDVYRPARLRASKGRT